MPDSVTGEFYRDATAVYSLGSGQDESARLQRQADELAADSHTLLDRIGLRPGNCAIGRAWSSDT